ncbi:MAG TPA: type II and III secretion system protein [Armatimonadota bacterium]|jgi:type IV pilus assembly protein PilQ
MRNSPRLLQLAVLTCLFAFGSPGFAQAPKAGPKTPAKSAKAAPKAKPKSTPKPVAAPPEPTPPVATPASGSGTEAQPTAPVTAPPVAPPPTPAPAPKPDGTITNVFAATDLVQALSDVSQAAGVTIIADSTVQGTVTADLKSVPLEKALNILLQAGGFAFAKVDDYYLVGLPDPSNPNYNLLTRNDIVDLKYMAPNVVIGMLSNSYGKYLAAEGDAPQQPIDSSQSRSSTRMGTPPGIQTRSGGIGGSSSSGPQRYRLVITAPPSMMDRIKSEIAKVDIEPAQVMLEAQVIEVSDDALKEFGIDWATHWLQQDLLGTGASLLYSNVAKTEMVSLKALITKGRAQLRANPRVATVEGQTAEMEVGKETYYAILTGSTAYQYATIEQITSGILLRITPRVLKAEGEISVRVEPEVRDVTGKGPNGLPEITMRRASTTMRVKDGQSIVIGGLVNETADHTESKLPILGDIPLLGQLFRHGKTAKSRTEVVIVITPHILDGTEVFVDPDKAKEK